MKRMTTKTMLLLTMIIAFFGLILVGIPSVAVADDCVCCKTPGYWKNHPDAWPVDGITIGAETYTKDEAIDIMMTPVRGDKTITMFKALVAAKLNVLSDCYVCGISGTIDEADEWFVDNGPVGSEVAASSDAWQIGECLYLTLDYYNNKCQFIDFCKFCD